MAPARIKGGSGQIKQTGGGEDHGERRLPRVRCKSCGQLVNRATAHRRAGAWVGDECGCAKKGSEDA